MADRPGSDERLRRAAALEEEATRLRAEVATSHPAPRQPESGKRRDAALLDSAMRVAVVVTDPDGRVTEWNSGAERLLGWTARDMQGRSIGRLFTPEDRAEGRPEREMRLALTEGRTEEETWHLRESGTRIRVAGEMLPLHDGEGRHVGYIKILRDRIAEEEARTALAESEQR